MFSLKEVPHISMNPFLVFSFVFLVEFFQTSSSCGHAKYVIVASICSCCASILIFLYFVPGGSVHYAVPSTHEVEYPDQQQSLTQMPESQPSGEVVVSSGTSAAPEYEQPKSEAPLVSEGPQYSVVHTPTYSAIGLIPPMLGSQFAPFESTETQGRDATRLPSFMVSSYSPVLTYKYYFIKLGKLFGYIEVGPDYHIGSVHSSTFLKWLW